MHKTYILKDNMSQSADHEDSPGAYRVPASESAFYLFIFWLLALLRSLWDLSSPTRGQTQAPAVTRQGLTTGLPRNSPHFSKSTPLASEN